MTSVGNLACEYRTNPLGIDVKKPRFSWKMSTDRQGAKQTAYRILAASSQEILKQGNSDVWDSGKISSDACVNVSYDGPQLQSRQRVYWTVTVWDETGTENQSETAWFEMGLLEQSDWQAQWIGSFLRGAPRSGVPAPYLRKPFALAQPVKAARLYVTAIGLYECTINGQVIGDDVFNPGWTDYKKRIQYNVYDVTDALQSGENVIGTVLGDGWAVGRVGMGNRQNYYDQPRIIAQLEVSLADGSTETIITDGTWKQQFGPIVDNDMLMGESYDARLELRDWDAPGYDAGHWFDAVVFEAPEAALVATNGPTVKRIQEVKPIDDPADNGSMIQPKWIFDLGQNMVGWVRFQGSAPAGTTVILRFAEVLDADGALYTTNLREARATDHYTFKGEGLEVWEPKFTFHGFRYVEISGYPGEVSRDTITGVVLHSEMARTGEFECSDPLLNQLQSNILWGQKGNFVDVPTDCPQRDERLGWTGDIQVFVRTAAYNMDVAGFMTKWAKDVADAQAAEGSVPAVVPAAIMGLPDGGPAWADAGIICPWTIYMCYGDTRILEENYTVMTRLMDFMVDTSPGYIRCAPEYEGWPGFGDWLSINAVTARDLIGTAFLAYDADLMVQIAEALGRDDDAAKYRQLFADVKSAFQKRFLKGGSVPETSKASAMRRMVDNADAISQGNLKVKKYEPLESAVFNTECFEATQTSYVLALHFNLLPEEMRDTAVKELVTDIKRRDMHLSTGFVGSPYLPHVLSTNGQLDFAYELLNQKTWPSWLYAVTQGATTIWERWDGWTEDNGFQDPGMNSFNHYAYGAIGAWLYNTVAGIEIDPDNPGYKHFIVRPQPGGDLDSAKGTLQTRYGEIVSSWKLENGAFDLTVTVPPNTSATVYLPLAEGKTVTMDGKTVDGDCHEVVAGTYNFKVS